MDLGLLGKKYSFGVYFSSNNFDRVKMIFTFAPPKFQERWVSG